MDAHTAHVFVKDTIFELTMTSLASHLWNAPLSDVGIHQELIRPLAQALGIQETGLTIDMSLNNLVSRVTNESRLDIRVERVPFFWSF